MTNEKDWMSERAWEMFKKHLKENGFNTDRLREDERRIKTSDDIFHLDIVTNYPKEKDGYFAQADMEMICNLTDEYIRDNVPAQGEDEDGEWWTDETRDMWLDRFVYAALFYKLCLFETYDDLDLLDELDYLLNDEEDEKD